jgi:hypothetical protein
MESNLRPMTLGEILDRTAQLYRSNFLLFAGIFAVYSGVLLVLGLVQIGMNALLKTQSMDVTLLWTIVFSIVIVWPVMLLMLGISSAAISRAVAWVHLGEPATIRGAYDSILPRLGRYLWLMAIIAFRVWTPLAVLYALFLGITAHFGAFRGMGAGNGAAAPPVFTNDPQAAVIFLGVMAIIFLLMLPASIYAILMSLRYSLAIPACVVENMKADRAIRRSIELARGAWGRIFMLALLVGVIKVVLVCVTQFFVFVEAFKHPGQLPGPGISSISQVIGFFTNTFLGPIWAAGITLFYFDQRVRKEGYDIEWMMQQAGMIAAHGIISAPVVETPQDVEFPQAMKPTSPTSGESL